MIRFNSFNSLLKNLFNRKSEFANAVVCFAGVEVRRWPSLYVRRVGVLLRLKADAGVLIVGDAFLASGRAVEEVARIYLNTRLVGVNFQLDASDRAVDGSGNLRERCSLVASLVGVEAPVVVEAVAKLDLLMCSVVVGDALADFSLGGAVECKALHALNLACGHVGCVHGGVVVSVDVDEVVVDGLCGIAVEVEVTMVGHVDDSLLVGGRRVVDCDDVVVVEGKLDGGLHVAREVHVAVRAVHEEYEFLVAARHNVINFVLPTVWTAVEAVSKVVERELDGLLVADNLALVDAVGIAADGRAEVRGMVYGVGVGGHLVKTEDDVLWLAVLVVQYDRNDASTEVCDLNLSTLSVFEGVEASFLAVDSSVEISGLDAIAELFFTLLLVACVLSSGCISLIVGGAAAARGKQRRRHQTTA